MFFVQQLALGFANEAGKRNNKVQRQPVECLRISSTNTSPLKSSSLLNKSNIYKNVL